MKHPILSNRIAKVPEYVFSKLAKEVKEVEDKTGRKVLNLGPGIPDVPTNGKYIKKFQ